MKWFYPMVAMISLAHPAMAANDPFTPHYPFKTAVITYLFTDDDGSTQRETLTIKGEKMLQVKHMKGGDTVRFLFTPEKKYIVDPTAKTIDIGDNDAGLAIMRRAYAELSASQQANVRRNRAALGIHTPLYTTGPYRPATNPVASEIAGQPVACYDAMKPIDPALISTECYWYGIALWQYFVVSETSWFTLEATDIRLDVPVDDALFELPDGYARQAADDYGIWQERYSRVVDRLAKSTADFDAIDAEKPFMDLGF